ncbi:MAG: hypothetical protein LBP37_02880 [Spirochaetaceae bacterium]|nr:hypothetical protein [Spirochaetaceae bacterium]
MNVRVKSLRNFRVPLAGIPAPFAACGVPAGIWQNDAIKPILSPPPPIIYPAM